MKAFSPVLLNDRTLQAALTCFPRDRAMRIDSEEVESGSGATFDRYSPAHGALVTRALRGTTADADRANAAARKAFDLGTWPKVTAYERSGVLLRTADLIDRDRELLAHLDSLESGKPKARREVAGAADIWRYAAALARTLHGESYASLGSARMGLVLREPIGVVSIITPWNFPLLIVSQKLPFALAAGCTCVVKPSEMTSASTLHLARLLDEAGLPKGVGNVVTGYDPEVGAPMTTDPRVLWSFRERLEPRCRHCCRRRTWQPARSGSIHSWTARRNCRSADPVSRVSGGSSGITLLPTIPKKKRFTFTKVRARARGSRGPEADQKDREPAQGFEKRRRTESGGRVRPGR